jgi:glycosyltransferase involved in cell wall biosynthesis
MGRAPSLFRRIEQFIDIARHEGVSGALGETRDFFTARLRSIPPEIRTGEPLDVVFVSGCPGPSERYRVHNIMAGLAESGFSACMIPAPIVPRLTRYTAPKNLVLFRCCEKYDEPLGPVIAEMRDRGTRVICDHDDLVFEPEIVNEIDGIRYLFEPRRERFRRNVVGYRDLVRACDAGTATTSFLAEWMRRLVPRADVIPNSVNREQMDLAEHLAGKRRGKNEALKIVYASGTKTHQKDFLCCADALARFLRDNPARFFAIGLLDLPECLLNLGDKIVRKPLLPYLDLLRETADCDINLAPLESTAFNHAKSELKLFEAGLVGVPTIASPTGSYTRCIENGIDGILADSPEEWEGALNMLASSPSARTEMGAKMREKTHALFNYRRAAAIATNVYELR